MGSGASSEPSPSSEPSSSEPSGTSEPSGLEPSEPASTGGEPSGEAAADPAYLVPEFSWDDWDGNVEGVHESLRPLVQGAVGWHEARLDREMTESKRDLEFYRAMGMGDNESIDKIRADMQAEYDAKFGTHAEKLAAVERRALEAEKVLQQQNEAEVDRWLHSNREVLADQDSKEKVWALINEDVDPDTAVALVGKPDEFIALTLAYMQMHGVRSDLAMRLAQADVGAAYGDGRSVEDAAPVAGAEPGPRARVNMDQQIDDPKMSAQDARRLAVKRAMAEIA